MLLLSLLLLLPLLPLSLLTIQFCDMQGREATQEFLGENIGFYAMDCARGASLDNPYQIFADYTVNGHLSGMVIGIRLSIKDAGYTSGYIDQVQLESGKNFLSYFVETLGDRYSFVWKKAGEEAIRLYQLEDATTHTRYVLNGVIPNTTIATPVYHHCRASMLAPGEEW